MLLTPAQSRIASDTHRFRVVNAGRRTGKTILAVEELGGVAISQDDRLVAYIAPTYRQARDIAWEELKKRWKNAITSINESRLELTIQTIHGGKSKIVLKGWESIESLRGQKFDFIVLDEVAMYKSFWLYWHEVIRPTLTDNRGGALFISTPKGFNHFYDLYNFEREDDDYKSYHFTTFDNPHIPVDELEKARKELPEDRFAQEYMADFRKQEGLVYKEFSRERHIFDGKEPRKPTVERIIGVDFGFTNPTAALLIEKDTDSHYWVSREWYQAGKTNAEVIEQLKTWESNIVYPDPAEPDRIEEMRRAGLNVREVSKDVTKGVDVVRNLFRQDRIHIHKDCQSLISELETYHYPDPKDMAKRTMDRNVIETPVKENDHACDALRYALYMQEPVLFEEDQDFNLYNQSWA